MENNEKSQEWIDNDNVIPSELKAIFAEKVGKVVNNIGRIESAVNEAIDNAIDDSEDPITITEIYAGIFNVLKNFNKQEIMEMVK